MVSGPLSYPSSGKHSAVQTVQEGACDLKLDPGIEEQDPTTTADPLQEEELPPPTQLVPSSSSSPDEVVVSSGPAAPMDDF